MTTPIRWGAILRDGLVLAAAFTVAVTASVVSDPMLWINDYPPDIRAAVGDPQVPAPGWLVGAFVTFLLGVFGYIVASVRRARRHAGGRLPFPAATLHAFLLLQFVNAWDVIIVDWLLFTALTPAFAVLPGTEGMAGYDDYWFHFEASFLNPGVWIGIVAAAATIAAVEAALAHRRPIARQAPSVGAERLP